MPRSGGNCAETQLATYILAVKRPSESCANGLVMARLSVALIRSAIATAGPWVCYVHGEELNAWLVSQGHALAYRCYSTQHVEQEEAAQAARRGMWAGAVVAPSRMSARSRTTSLVEW